MAPSKPIYNALPTHMRSRKQKDGKPLDQIQCPLCGSRMRLKKRLADQNPFYGCINWEPDGKGCNGIRNSKEVDEALDSGRVAMITRNDDTGVADYIKHWRDTQIKQPQLKKTDRVPYKRDKEEQTKMKSCRKCRYRPKLMEWDENCEMGHPLMTDRASFCPDYAQGVGGGESLADKQEVLDGVFTPDQVSADLPKADDSPTPGSSPAGGPFDANKTILDKPEGKMGSGIKKKTREMAEHYSEKEKKEAVREAKKLPKLGLGKKFKMQL